MPQRDHLASLQARLDAQARELEDTKSELALARAAYTRQRSVSQRLSQEFGALASERAEDEAPTDDGRIDARGRDASAGVALLRALLLAAIVLGVLFPLIAIGVARVQRASAVESRPVSHMLRRGRVIRTLGPEVVAVGEQCSVERLPVHAGPFDCRVVVRCGAQTLYGASDYEGYLRCDGREFARDPDATIRDGDPSLVIDLARGVVAVEDRVGMATQRVEIALEPEPAFDEVAFGSPSVEDAHATVLRMTDQVTAMQGVRREDGFEVTFPGTLSMDLAAPIARSHPAVAYSAILNRDRHAVLNVRFVPGHHPDYGVVARGESVQVSIGN